jgi:hypothetical protein
VDRLRDHVVHVEADLKAKAGLIEELESQVRRTTPLRRLAEAPPGALGPRRLAVLGTPGTGDTWLRELLARVFSAEQLAAQHPADLSWEALPERMVLQLHWQPTEYLRRLLRAHHVAVVSVARHPLDVLLAVLRSAQREHSARSRLQPEVAGEQLLRGATPNDEVFLEWAQGPTAAGLLAMTPAWWRDEDTIQVRYEQLCAAPAATLRAIAGTGLRLPNGDLSVGDEEREVLDARICQAVEMKAPEHPEPSRGVQARPASPGRWEQLLLASSVERLVAAHPEIWDELGYPVATSRLTDRRAAQHVWQLSADEAQ